MCNDPKIRILFDDEAAALLRERSPYLFFRLRKRVFRCGVFLDKENSEDMKLYAKIKADPQLEQLIQLVPCFKCCGCRADWSAQWTARCLLESRKYKSNLFVTLTYNDENLPSDGQLRKIDYQLFLKRLRKYCAQHDMPSPRYRICGEYGEKNGRPHFHLILFNLELPDMKLFYYTDGRKKRPRPFKHAYPLFLSEILAKIWGKGFVQIGHVSYAQIKYVSNYQLKSLGQDREVKPFAQSSTRPALARDYFDENFFSIVANDSLPKGLNLRVSHVQYFDRLLRRDFPEVWFPIRDKRISVAKAVEYDTDLDYFDMLKARERRLQKAFQSKHRD